MRSSGYMLCVFGGPVLLVSVVTLLLIGWASPASGIGVASLRTQELADSPEKLLVSNNIRGPSLPTTIVPIDYFISLHPEYEDPIENTTDFNGEVRLTFYVNASTSTVSIHAASDLSFTDATVTYNNGTDQSTTTFARQNDGTYRITTSPALITNETYTALISFTAKFQETTNGFYKSTYQKEDNTTGVLFTTHFQPVYARKAFPCLDEPHLKATFQLSIDVPSGYDVLSNTEVDSRTNKDGDEVEEVTFKSTVPMSTYLVAFVVYEKDSFIPTASVSLRNEVINTWAPKNSVEAKLTEYSQDISLPILRELENFTGIEYIRDNMTKIDQVAVADFSAGAMENWGLIIYRDSRLFYNEAEDAEATRKSVAAIIAHELTHQWFGNLVTTRWWSTTWLNEGFARYFQYLILSRIYPNWRMMDQLILDQQMAIFSSDSLIGALPLTYDVTTEQQINDRFGTITYSKGASIVRMISYMMEEENFQKGLQQYLERGTVPVTPSDLFSDLQDHLPEDRKPSVSLEEAMNTWTDQAGFPVVHVERNYTLKNAAISQYRFFTDGTTENAANATTYNIPITWSSKDNAMERFFWLSEDTTLTRVPEMENWMLVHAKGYFRVNYDEFNWASLAYTLKGNQRSEVSTMDRAKLVDDSLALSFAGILPYRALGYILQYLPEEVDVLPWAAVNRGFLDLESTLGNVDDNGVFYGYIRRALSAIYKELNGFASDGEAPELILRSTVMKWACRSGHEECLELAVERLKLYLDEGASLDPNLKDVILCYGSRAGGNEVWEKLWKIYNSSEDTSERSSLFNALACTEDRSILDTFFQRVALQDPSDTRSAFQASMSHPKGVAGALDFILERFTELVDWTNQETAETILEDVVDKLTSESQYLRMNNFLENLLLEDVFNEEFVDDNQAKVKKNFEDVNAYAKTALEVFSKATPEDTTVPYETTTEGGSSRHTALIQLVPLLAMILVLGEYLC